MQNLHVCSSVVLTILSALAVQTNGSHQPVQLLGQGRAEKKVLRARILVMSSSHPCLCAGIHGAGAHKWYCTLCWKIRCNSAQWRVSRLVILFLLFCLLLNPHGSNLCACTFWTFTLRSEKRRFATCILRGETDWAPIGWCRVFTHTTPSMLPVILCPNLWSFHPSLAGALLPGTSVSLSWELHVAAELFLCFRKVYEGGLLPNGKSIQVS